MLVRERWVRRLLAERSRTMHARLWRWRVPIGAATAAVAGGCVTRMLLTPKPEPNRSDEASRARLAVSRQAPKVVRVAYRDALSGLKYQDHQKCLILPA